MNLGRPRHFRQTDKADSMVSKLNDTFSNIWRIFGEISGAQGSTTSCDCNGHTSPMPDTAGTNADHDKRYMTRTEAYTKFFYQSLVIDNDMVRVVANDGQDVIVDHR